MLSPNYNLLYVDNPQASGAFYARLFGREPIEASPTFVMFRMESGAILGLWSRRTVAPAPEPSVGGSEVGIRVPGQAAVDRTCADWKTHGVRIVQEPTDMDFGRTFVGLDPDGHRVRVFGSDK